MAKTEIHRINGEIATMDTLSARETVRNHPEEWSVEPFSAEEQKKARKDPSIMPYVPPETYTYGHGTPHTRVPTA